MPGNPPPAPSPTEGCWDWTGCVDRRGYGYFNVNGRKVKAHRAAYRLFVGPFTDELNILHSCDRPICVQPAHLRPGTQADNVDEAVERNRFPVGEARLNTKLTVSEVTLIKASPLSGGKLAVMLGVNPSTIYDIRNGVTWKHV